ncbi:MAG TPA: hypothetical protein DIU15_01300 [Deltaproteobacteria bacterium]|nr:hypothetical protein [Deltaproteobacteria bacterium]
MDPREQLSAYLDGVLVGADRERVEEALLADPSLRAELDDLRMLIEDVGTLSSEQAPDGFVQSVMTEVQVYPIPGGEGVEPGRDAARGQGLVELSWWFKGPVVSLLAATLVVGVIIYRGGVDAPVPSALRPSASLQDWFETADAEIDSVRSLEREAPRPTGGDGFEDDGVVDAPMAEPEGVVAARGDVPSPRRGSAQSSMGQGKLQALDSSASSEPARTREVPLVVARKRVARDAEAAPERRRGRKGAGGSATKERASGLRELRGADGEAEQVYEADHELWEHQEDARVDAWDGGTGDAVATPGPPDEVAPGAESEPAPAAAPDLRETDGVVLTEDERLAESSGDSLAVASRPLLRGGADGTPREGSQRSSGVAETPVEQSKPEQGDQLEGDTGSIPVPEPEETTDQQSIAVGVVIGSLRIQAGAGLSLLRSEILKRGWSMQDLTPTGLEEEGSGAQSHIIQLMVPKGDEEQLVALLRRYGSLSTDGALQAGRDGMARLRVTVKEWFGVGKQDPTGAIPGAGAARGAARKSP